MQLCVSVCSPNSARAWHSNTSNLFTASGHYITSGGSKLYDQYSSVDHSGSNAQQFIENMQIHKAKSQWGRLLRWYPSHPVCDVCWWCHVRVCVITCVRVDGDPAGRVLLSRSDSGWKYISVSGCEPTGQSHSAQRLSSLKGAVPPKLWRFSHYLLTLVESQVEFRSPHLQLN